MEEGQLKHHKAWCPHRDSAVFLELTLLGLLQAFGYIPEVWKVDFDHFLAVFLLLLWRCRFAEVLNLLIQKFSFSVGYIWYTYLHVNLPRWKTLYQEAVKRGFPGGAVVGNMPANAGDTGSSPGLGRSHMPRSNWAREPRLLSLRVWSLCSATREAAIVRSPRTAMKSGPRSPQLEKALAQKRRPNTAKNK